MVGEDIGDTAGYSHHKLRSWADFDDLAARVGPATGQSTARSLPGVDEESDRDERRARCLDEPVDADGPATWPRGPFSRRK